MREALRFIWNEIATTSSDPGEIQRRFARCEAVIPDSEDFSSSDYTSAAINAGCAILTTLAALRDPSLQRIVDASTYCRDTVDLFIQSRDDLDYSDPDFEGKIARDPLMVEEMVRQASMLAQLKGVKELDQPFLDRLRAEAHGDGVSNIRLRG